MIVHNYGTYFYAHGNFYFIVLKNNATLCLCTFDTNDQLNELVCELSIDDWKNDRCPFVIDPYSPGVIYANLNLKNGMTRAHISFDNGQNFRPIEIEGHNTKCILKNCVFELELRCSNDFLKNSFQKKSIVKFRGRDQNWKHHLRYDTFVSLNGGETWKKIYLEIERLTIANNGGLFFGKGGFTGQIMYSFDQGINWHNERIVLNNIIGIIPIETPKNQRFAVVDYNQGEFVYTFFIFDFSKAKSNFYLMIENSPVSKRHTL
ncbi:hypothetical protein RF11_00435 [Thelohanellus kitauei]|uniref:Sortilin N-terminal domain-containing protein n=1 Tax=Thelohanellus kitauei TaxID=669202 RepID=A0A0C2M7P3_THEKT|nr:hypothetical protein RF11_00435 [Thelohanellus kitauei]